MCDYYWNNKNNYYLYYNTTDKYNYKFFFIPFDYDNTLGTSQGFDAGRRDGETTPTCSSTAFSSSTTSVKSTKTPFWSLWTNKKACSIIRPAYSVSLNGRRKSANMFPTIPGKIVKSPINQPGGEICRITACLLPEAITSSR